MSSSVHRAHETSRVVGGREPRDGHDIRVGRQEADRVGVEEATVVFGLGEDDPVRVGSHHGGNSAQEAAPPL